MDCHVRPCPNRPHYTPPPAPIVVDREDNFAIEAFRDVFRRQLQFDVKWVGYQESENTWQYAKQLQEDMLPEFYQDLLQDYQRRSQANI